MYAHSNELDEVGVISLDDSSIKVEHMAEMDILFDVSRPIPFGGTPLRFQVTSSVNLRSRCLHHPIHMLSRPQAKRSSSHGYSRSIPHIFLVRSATK
jgi:hypothetical protein